MSKTLLNLLCAFLLSWSLSAQDSFRPLPGELGVGLKAKGLGPVARDNFEPTFNFPELQLRYSNSDLLTFRVDIGLKGSANNALNRDTSVNNSIVTTTESKNSVRETGFILSPGLEYHFEGTSRLDPYAGAQLDFQMMGRKKTTTEFDKKTGDTFAQNAISELTEPGSIEYGLRLFAGFNYFIADRLAMGLDYSLGFKTERSGGKTLQYAKEVINSGGVVTTFEFKDETFSEISKTEFKNFGVLSFNIVYFFGAF